MSNYSPTEIGKRKGKEPNPKKKLPLEEIESFLPKKRRHLVNPRKWTTDEDNRLRVAIDLFGEYNWKAISQYVSTRDNVQCLQRWQKVIRPGLVKGPWSAEEDALLTTLVGKNFKNWGKLANHMPGRTSKQCRERWFHHLDPSVKKTDYTKEEDELIIKLHEKWGNCWSAISKFLPGRTENSIRSRFKSLKLNNPSLIQAIANSNFDLTLPPEVLATQPKSLEKKNKSMPFNKQQSRSRDSDNRSEEDNQEGGETDEDEDDQDDDEDDDDDNQEDDHEAEGTGAATDEVRRKAIVVADISGIPTENLREHEKSPNRPGELTESIAAKFSPKLLHRDPPAHSMGPNFDRIKEIAARGVPIMATPPLPLPPAGLATPAEPPMPVPQTATKNIVPMSDSTPNYRALSGRFDRSAAAAAVSDADLGFDSKASEILCSLNTNNSPFIPKMAMPAEPSKFPGSFSGKGYPNPYLSRLDHASNFGIHNLSTFGDPMLLPFQHQASDFDCFSHSGQIANFQRQQMSQAAGRMHTMNPNNPFGPHKLQSGISPFAPHAQIYQTMPHFMPPQAQANPGWAFYSEAPKPMSRGPTTASASAPVSTSASALDPTQTHLAASMKSARFRGAPASFPELNSPWEEAHYPSVRQTLGLGLETRHESMAKPQFDYNFQGGIQYPNYRSLYRNHAQ